MSWCTEKKSVQDYNARLSDTHLTQGGFVLVSLDENLLCPESGNSDIGAGPGLKSEAATAQGGQAVQHWV